MSLHKDLIEQARHLASREAGKPKQASLRRAVSAAYYALFHLLTEESTKFLISGTAASRKELRQVLRRSYVHAEMKSVSKAFAGGTPPKQWKTAAGTISADVRLVAETFFELQDARHEADYDHSQDWKRREVIDLVMRCEQAFVAWDRAKGAEDADTYLVALLVKARLS